MKNISENNSLNLDKGSSLIASALMKMPSNNPKVLADVFWEDVIVYLLDTVFMSDLDAKESFKLHLIKCIKNSLDEDVLLKREDKIQEKITNKPKIKISNTKNASVSSDIIEEFFKDKEAFKDSNYQGLFELACYNLSVDSRKFYEDRETAKNFINNKLNNKLNNNFIKNSMSLFSSGD